MPETADDRKEYLTCDTRGGHEIYQLAHVCTGIVSKYWRDSSTGCVIMTTYWMEIPKLITMRYFTNPSMNPESYAMGPPPEEIKDD